RRRGVTALDGLEDLLARARVAGDVNPGGVSGRAVFEDDLVEVAVVPDPAGEVFALRLERDHVRRVAEAVRARFAPADGRVQRHAAVAGGDAQGAEGRARRFEDVRAERAQAFDDLLRGGVVNALARGG